MKTTATTKRKKIAPGITCTSHLEGKKKVGVGDKAERRTTSRGHLVSSYVVVAQERKKRETVNCRGRGQGLQGRRALFAHHLEKGEKRGGDGGYLHYFRGKGGGRARATSAKLRRVLIICLVCEKKERRKKRIGQKALFCDERKGKSKSPRHR